MVSEHLGSRSTVGPPFFRLREAIGESIEINVWRRSVRSHRHHCNKAVTSSLSPVISSFLTAVTVEESIVCSPNAILRRYFNKKMRIHSWLISSHSALPKRRLISTIYLFSLYSNSPDNIRVLIIRFQGAWNII